MWYKNPEIHIFLKNKTKRGSCKCMTSHWPAKKETMITIQHIQYHHFAPWQLWCVWLHPSDAFACSIIIKNLDDLSYSQHQVTARLLHILLATSHIGWAASACIQLLSPTSSCAHQHFPFRAINAICLFVWYYHWCLFCSVRIPDANFPVFRLSMWNNADAPWRPNLNNVQIKIAAAEKKILE